MRPENEGTVVTRRAIEQRWRWYQFRRCVICTRWLWFYSIVIKEASGGPELRHEWVLCTPCHEALLVELRRTSLRSPERLRIALGLVAAERSPNAYSSSPLREQQEFEREFTWFKWLMILFALLHVVILVILWAAPR